jgi:hypothetical protein
MYSKNMNEGKPIAGNDLGNGGLAYEPLKRVKRGQMLNSTVDVNGPDAGDVTSENAREMFNKSQDFYDAQNARTPNAEGNQGELIQER